jgi:hypothetical protein
MVDDDSVGIMVVGEKNCNNREALQRLCDYIDQTSWEYPSIMLLLLPVKLDWIHHITTKSSWIHCGVDVYYVWIHRLPRPYRYIYPKKESHWYWEELIVKSSTETSNLTMHHRVFSGSWIKLSGNREITYSLIVSGHLQRGSKGRAIWRRNLICRQIVRK